MASTTPFNSIACMKHTMANFRHITNVNSYRLACLIIDDGSTISNNTANLRIKTFNDAVYIYYRLRAMT